MRISFYQVLAIIFLAAIMPACKVQKKNINYLSADTRDSSHLRIWQNYDAKIQPGDRLLISISALNPASAQVYSVGAGGAAGSILVDSKGEIIYPQLGLLKVAGLTRSEMRQLLLEKLSVYLKDPVVNVEFANFKVTVLGEVNKQGPIPVPDGRLTILEAIGQSGDITLTGKRDSILVIREVNGRREFGSVNLLSNEVFKSPYFTLQQNDIVYVPMVKSKAMVSEKEQKTLNFQTITSILGIISTVGFLILNFRNF